MAASASAENGSVRSAPVGRRHFCDVAIPHTRLKELTYHYDAAALPGLGPGDCVRVRLRGRRVRALVVRVGESTRFRRTLGVDELVESRLVEPELVRLTERVNSYYFGRFGATLGSVLPRGVCGYGLRVRPETPAVADSSVARVRLAPDLEAAAGQGGRGVWVSARTTGQAELAATFVGRLLCRGSAVALAPEPELGRWQQALESLTGHPVARYDARLTGGRRRQAWLDLRQARRQLVLGTRAAVFAPVPDLAGLLVVDEHDRHFKEERFPRFHARDVAVLRAHDTGCPVLLLDPRPSVETWYNIRHGSYQLTDQPEAAVADTRVVDMRRHRELVSPLVGHELANACARGDSAVLYINRRGLSKHVVCTECGTVLVCPDCGVTLALDTQGLVQCRWCGRSAPAPDSCPACSGESFDYRAPGLEMAEREVRRLQPDARVAVVQAEAAGSGSGSAILIGTAALLGRAWPERVGLVAALAADCDLCRPDFRAREATFQVLAALSSRAAAAGAKFIVQTRRPDDIAVRCALEGRVGEFLDSELEARSEAGFAPARRLAALEFSGHDAGLLKRHAESVRRRLSRWRGVEVLGPVPLPGRRGGVQMLVKLARPRRLDALATLEQLERPGVRVRVDVDPLQL